MEKESKIYVAGHRGLVGSATLRALNKKGYHNIIHRTHQELDLTNQQKVRDFFSEEKPEYVVLAAAKVGGIHANATYPADFITQNIQIQTNVITSAYENQVKKLLFLGSSCIYPKDCPQPIKEEYLLTSELEKTNEAYAIAKITGLKMCQFYKEQYGAKFISAMPCNLYGIGDNFHPVNSHVLPALIRKFHEAKINKKSSVTLWGTGKPRREFLYADDLGEALVFLLENYEGKEHINIGAGKDQTITELAEIIRDIVGFQGTINYDHTKPDGTFRKLMDSRKINDMGWKPSTSLEKGIKKAYDNYILNKE